MKKSKSSKGKEKKLQHKQRLAEIAKSQAVINEANKLVDPMQHFAAFQKFDRNGLQLSVECKRASEMSREDLNWAFQVTKRNMQELYDAGGWKWNDRKTRGELEHEKSWYLVARDSDSPVGFVTFRYELGDEDMEICYCYEVHVEEQCRSKGLGKFLLQLLELLCHRAKMRKIICTVLKVNDQSIRFFRDKLKYSGDTTCPNLCDPLNAEDYCYEILSKSLSV